MTRGDPLGLRMTDLFDHYARRTREAFARGLGCDVEAFDGEQLTIIDRPADSNSHTLRAATFGTGTVISVDPAYRGYIEANPPRRHYSALSGAFLGALAAEGKRRGDALEFHPAALCFTLAQQHEEEPLPPGIELRRHDAGWMDLEQANRRFENAVGEPGHGREGRNRFALALYRDDKPIAVAGAFDTYGMLEIGIDVVRAHRGSRLGRAMVLRITRAIIDEGMVPVYVCPPANIRSHRTAESCGFRIVCARALVSAPV
jgi:GNAT superfamily N-acetyltransferase